MSLLLDKEYFHFGTDNIYKELWGRLQMIHNNKSYTKPIGGLWTTHLDPIYVCDWLRYMELRDMYHFDYYIGNKKSSLIKFKNDSKLLSIENENDYKNLKDSGFIITLEQPININPNILNRPIFEIPDYEKISEYYDLMYVDYFVHDCFRQYCVNTMLAINSDAVEYYKSLSVDYLNHEIINTSDKKYISKPSKEYYEFLIYVSDLLNEIKANTFEEFMLKLEKLKKIIISDLEKNFDFSKLNLPNGIDKSKFISATVNNVSFEKYKLAKKMFDK